jgi:mono/diheme cytochrome c family protein
MVYFMITLPWRSSTGDSRHFAEHGMLRRLPLFLALGLAPVFSPSVECQKTTPESKERKVNLVSGKETFLQYCASCHGKTAKGDGPAAFVMKPSPADLTTLAKRNEGKYPAGSVSAILRFGRSFAAHGASDMPVWGTRFKNLDPVHDPTGQQHIDDLVAYVQSLQVK